MHMFRWCVLLTIFCLQANRLALAFQAMLFLPALRGAKSCVSIWWGEVIYVIYLMKFSTAAKTMLFYWMFSTGPTVGLPVIVHYISSFSFLNVHKWLCLQNACNSGFVLSFKAFYTSSDDHTIFFTEPVNSLLSARSGICSLFIYFWKTEKRTCLSAQLAMWRHVKK